MPYSSKTANQLLFSPFDSKAAADKTITTQMTEQEFITKCYVNPQFSKKQVLPSIVDDNVEVVDYIIKESDIIDIIEQQKKEVELFEKWLTNNNKKAYTISGNAGTGKTTYVHWLRYKYKSIRWTILDVASANDTVEWYYNIKTDIQDFYKPYNKLYSIILSTISNYVFLHDSEEKDVLKRIKTNIKAIVNNYNKFLKPYRLEGANYIYALEKCLLTPLYINNKNLITSCAKASYQYFKSVETEYRNNKLDIS